MQDPYGDDTRIPSGLLVAGALRACMAAAKPAYILHKGAPESGAIMVKIVLKNKTCRLLDRTRDGDGRLVWTDVFSDTAVDEKKADDYIVRARSRDPDLWVVEVEDDNGQNPFEA